MKTRRTPKRTKAAKARQAPESYEEFLANSGIKQLGLRIRVLQAQSEAMGFPPDHREPLKCPKCGLMESTDDNDLLITTRTADSRDDSGLRFDKLTDGRYLCPGCAARVVEPEFKIPPDLFK